MSGRIYNIGNQNYVSAVEDKVVPVFNPTNAKCRKFRTLQEVKVSKSKAIPVTGREGP
jgi:hypothetical protein